MNTCTARPENAAVLVFTSGTTGTPKPVELTHANIMSNVMALRSEKIVGSGDRALVPLPLHHIYPLTVGTLTVLASGATVIFPSGLSGPELVEAMRTGEVTALLGVPGLYSSLLASLRAGVARRKGLTAPLFSALLTLSSLAKRRLGINLGHVMFRRVRAEIGPNLRLLVSGGAALKLADERVLNALGWQVLTGYGLTETSPILTFNRPRHSRIGSAGQALPGVRLRIVNRDTGGIGEIQVAGVSVFAGYLKDEAATRAAFTPDGWFRTGDLGYLDADCYLYVTGRVTETIILPNGKKINPEELEAQYMADPVIQEIAIFGNIDGLVALVVPNESLLRMSGTLRAHDRIADAILIRGRTLPSYLRLSGFAITRTALPRTPLGKLRRYLLPPLYARSVQRDQPQSVQPVTPAASPQDPRAAALWQWLRARYPGKTLVPDTSLQLDLGVDSLGWIDLGLALQQTFGITLSEQQISHIITIDDLLRESLAMQINASPLSPREDADTWPAPYGFILHGLRAIGEPLLRLVMRSGFRLDVDGIEYLPAPPFVICPNHTSYLDGFALAAALPHRVLDNSYFAGWTGLLFATRLERLFSRTAQIIPVDPDRAVATAIATASAVLRHGKTLIWFPEGKISPDANLQKFQPGIGAVLKNHPAPVVPAWISGAATALPPGKKIPRLHSIKVSFGPVIEITAIARAAAEGAATTERTYEELIANKIHEGVSALAFASRGGRCSPAKGPEQNSTQEGEVDS